MSAPDIDWAQAWIDEQERRGHAPDESFWNGRAAGYSKDAGQSPYVPDFIERAVLLPGETVLDMGCGPGTLSLPLAQAGHHVYACDFSQAMLEELERAARAQGVSDLITPMLLSWDEEWQEGRPPVCDVAIASRSIATDDMRTSLAKLDSRARRRVCITLTSGLSPRVDAVLLEAIGRSAPRCPDCVFGFNILWQMGKHPTVGYMDNPHPSAFASFEEAVEKNADAMRVTPEERERLVAYTREHLHEVTGAQGATHWEYDHVRTSSWAFLAWDK